jgi:hypothetical protein
MTFSLRGNTSGHTRLHSSPLTDGNALNERSYDGLGTAATATELHRAAPRRTRSCCCWGCSATGARQQRHSTQIDATSRRAAVLRAAAPDDRVGERDVQGATRSRTPWRQDPAGVCARIAQRVLTLTAAIWRNDALSLDVPGSLTAYDFVIQGRRHLRRRWPRQRPGWLGRTCIACTSHSRPTRRRAPCTGSPRAHLGP